MPTGFPRIRWKRVLLASFLASALTALLLTPVIGICVLTTGWWVEDASDQARAERLLSKVVDWAVPVVGALSTVATVAWVSRKMNWTTRKHHETLRVIQMKLEIHGLLVGLVLGAIGLTLYLDRLRTLPALASFLLPLGSGWLGAVLGARKKSAV